MSQPTLIFEGLETEGLHIPSFQLIKGNAICLKWPVGSVYEGCAYFANLLKQEKSSFVLNGTVQVCQPVQFITKLFGSSSLAYFVLRFLPVRLHKTLRALGAMVYYMVEGERSVFIDAELDTWIRTVTGLEQAPVTSLQACDRRLLSFARACEQADVVVFSISGCDPPSTYKKMEAYIKENTFIELKFSSVSSVSLLSFHDGIELAVETR